MIFAHVWMKKTELSHLNSNFSSFEISCFPSVQRIRMYRRRFQYDYNSPEEEENFCRKRLKNFGFRKCSDARQARVC